MGPGLIRNNTAEKAKEYIACVNNLFYLNPNYNRFVKCLKDGRVICTDPVSEAKIKIFKLMNNKFIENIEFPKDIINTISPIFCEIDENIILFAASYRDEFIDS